MKKRLLATLIVLVLMVCVCCKKGDTSSIDGKSDSTLTNDKYTYQAGFDIFTDEIFTDYVTKDSISLNYLLAEPENYGINDYTPTFGTFTKDAMDADTAILNEYYTTLQTFDRDNLSKDQQLTYDILKEYLENQLHAGDFYYISEPLSPTTGLQAQLPILLAEYHFYDEQDVVDYLKLLTCIDTYYDQICTFEKEKSDKGLFMSDSSANAIIDQCQKFITNPDENYLITTFSDRLSGIVTDSGQKKAYIEQNISAVKNHIIPAYEKLIETLTSLRGTGVNEGGVCNYENGKEYFEYLVKGSVGSYRSIDEIKELFNSYLTASMLDIQKIAAEDQSALASSASPSYPLTDPNDIMNYLKTAITDDFPTLSSVNCTIKYVDKSLEEHLSPAFYLTPPIDKYSDNMVYINQGGRNDMSSIFTTLAHEGYPGHLFQTVYYNQQNPSLVRSVIDFGGYTEGWATYVECYSYDLAGLDTNVSALLKCNLLATLCLYGNIDLGVNYYGWDKESTTKYLAGFGIADETSINSIYNAIVAEPGNYLKYILGFAELLEMKKTAENALGDDFVLKDFHTFILDMGPTQFNIMNSYLQDWIDSRK